MASRIEDYAIIGDCETAALVSREGAIDWLCWPTFSSNACFAALLGTEENGYWRIQPCGGKFHVSRKYREHTLILETSFESGQGSVRLTDFMPERDQGSHVVRMVEGLGGRVGMRMELALRFDYGRTVPWVTKHNHGIRAVAGPSLAVLHSSIPTHGENFKTVCDFVIQKGDRAWFTLSYGASNERDPKPIDADRELRDAERFWQRWTLPLRGKGRKYQREVERSLITLKALTYRPTGGVVAAVTTSLPEAIGGSRNWDYRYCWLRDTTFTLRALMNGGFYEEAVAWRKWLVRSLAGSPDQVQIMYGISGERQLVEWEVDWLCGYENSRPVRIGNAASRQLQLDIYGEVMGAFFHERRRLPKPDKQHLAIWLVLIEHLRTIWREPDAGIWESRGEPRQFTYSKMMAWVAFDRAIVIAEERGYEAPLEEWKRTRDEIHAEVCQKAFNSKLNSFVQSYGSDQLDAALLQMPMVGFLPSSDPRVKGTIAAIERKLMRKGYVTRYDTDKVDDSLPAGEGAFLACSFWMVSCLKAVGRKREARKMFERLLELRNDVGLLSEEYDVERKRLVGNFPQAFSHIALVNAAFELEAGSREGRRQRVRKNTRRRVSR